MTQQGSDPPRNPRDIQGLLRICMETAPQITENDSSRSPMTEERRQWLNEALSGLTTDIIQQMAKNIDVIKEGLNSFEATNGMISLETVDDMEMSIDNLIEYTGSLDNASDFHKIGGFDVFKPLLESTSDTLKLKACELLSEVVQNHSHCQGVALSYNLLEILVKILDEDNNENVRIKALYSISCMIRDNNSAQIQFDSQLDGFSVLLRVMQSTYSSQENKLRIKASFLISSLCRQHLPFLDTIYNMGFIEQLIALLNTEHDSSHEHILAALYAMASQHTPSRRECQRNNLGLEGMLNDRIEFLRNKSEYLEEQDYCKSLLELCFVETNELCESER